MVYVVFLDLWPQSAFQGIVFDGRSSQFDNILYFSFVTLTTSGFGDITPINPLLRTIVYLEMVAGQFYMAILVSSLVANFVGLRMTRWGFVRISSIARIAMEPWKSSSSPWKERQLLKFLAILAYPLFAADQRQILQTSDDFLVSLTTKSFLDKFGSYEKGRLFFLYVGSHGEHRR